MRSPIFRVLTICARVGYGLTFVLGVTVAVLLFRHLLGGWGIALGLALFPVDWLAGPALCAYIDHHLTPLVVFVPALLGCIASKIGTIFFSAEDGPRTEGSTS